jgi:methionine synthase / methylenetetrahydrofolate reductase (NADH)
VNERQRFRERLARAPVLLDGGMGTLLFASGVPQRACLDELATTRPDLVGAIHRAYLAAGAEVIETATFGANRIRLAAFGLAAEAGRLNRRAAQVAREARDVSGREALVAGSIGPLGAPTRELLHLDDAAIRTAFREQVDGLLEGGVDLFMIETFVDLRHLLLAIDEARKASDEHPIVAQMTFGEELELADGSSPAAAASTLASTPVDVIGVNCGAGPHACLEALEAFGPAARDAPARSIAPNAGLPQRVDGQFVYAADPRYFAASVARMTAAGASLVGGCCGTTPEHTAAMRAALDSVAASASSPAPAPPAAMGTRPSIVERVGTGATEGERPPPTQLLAKLRAGRYVVSVEIDPPRSIRIDRTIEAARLLRDAGVDLVNVSDSAMARVRMGCMAVAFGIQHDLDLECLVHFTSRDRNLMAIESELLGAHALGVRNILALTGDPPPVADYATGTGVWDVDSIGLVEVLSRLNRGEDQAGSPIGQPAGFTIACALDPTAADSATEWDRLERKLAAGADLVMTQPLYGIEQVEAMFTEARRRFGEGGVPVPLLLGILPLQSARHAEFLHHEVPGITIPDETRAAMHAAGERGAEVGLEESLALLEQVGDAVAGTYIMPSFGRYEQCAELVRRIRTRQATRATA